jgi:hypothetical protein
MQVNPAASPKEYDARSYRQRPNATDHWLRLHWRAIKVKQDWERLIDAS